MALAQDILLSFSVNSDYEDALYEWEFLSFKNHEGKCICGQELTKLYIIRNTENDTELCLGKDCLKALQSEILADTGKIRERESRGLQRKPCACCLKLLVPLDDPRIIKCRTCHQNQVEVKQAYKNLYFRPCKDCGEKDILPTAESWCNLCTACYEVKRSISRECKQCGEKRIPPTARESEDICYPCKQSGAKKPCSGCGEFNISVHEQWRKLCIACWRKTKK